MCDDFVLFVCGWSCCPSLQCAFSLTCPRPVCAFTVLNPCFVRLCRWASALSHHSSQGLCTFRCCVAQDQSVFCFARMCATARSALSSSGSGSLKFKSTFFLRTLVVTICSCCANWNEASSRPTRPTSHNACLLRRFASTTSILLPGPACT